MSVFMGFFLEFFSPGLIKKSDKILTEVRLSTVITKMKPGINQTKLG